MVQHMLLLDINADPADPSLTKGILRP